MWTITCTAAKAMMTMPVSWGLPSTPDITSQKGMAVRITDRPKPIM